jgi:hypothetical protein
MIGAIVVVVIFNLLWYFLIASRFREWFVRLTLLSAGNLVLAVISKFMAHYCSTGGTIGCF